MKQENFAPKDFQRATIERVYDLLYGADSNGTDRVLVADEVGLGKTIVAKSVIAKRLAAIRKNTTFRVVYICNSGQIARQNIRKLDVSRAEDSAHAVDRLTMLAANPPSARPGLQLMALSPGTSFSLRGNGGKMAERAFLLYLLRHDPTLSRRRSIRTLLSLGFQDSPSWAEHQGRAWEAEPKFVKRFLRKVKREGLLEEIHRFLDERKYRDESLRECRVLIGHLRRVLAGVSLKSLQPDLIILDEFQRFRQLLEITDGDAVTTLAQQLFTSGKVKLLLLSATPFKMMTLRAEDHAGEGHYADFHFLVDFLRGNDPERKGEFVEAWAEYTRLLNRMATGEIRALSRSRTRVQDLLKNAVCRTERGDLNSGLGDTLLRRAEALPLAAEDLRAYVAGERLAQAYRAAGTNLYGLIGFYKSVPFPFSFLRSYQFAKAWVKHAPDPELEALRAAAVHWLPLSRINQYDEISYPCSAFRFLLGHAFAERAERLLWIPPSRPTYELSGPYAGTEGYSKTLLFSNYRMVPRAIATLSSYEAERRTIGQLRRKGRYPGTATYFKADGSTTENRPHNRLRLSGHRVVDAVVTLLYPSPSLATWRLPEVNTLGQARELIAATVNDQIRSKYLDDGARGDVDQDWYWQLPILMDKTNFGGERMAVLMAANPDLLPERYYRRALAICNQPKARTIGELGVPPPDLAEVIADQILASPAITGLRILLTSHSFPADEAAAHLLREAGNIGQAFRRFFNRPEATAAVEASYPKATYWRQVLAYCRDGDLTAVLREYYYVFTTSASNQSVPLAGRATEFAAQLTQVLGLTTASFEADAYRESRRLRTHFAAAFSTEQSEDGWAQREEHVQAAFNAPFRPFVLATTSVGQEGLDFHHYARHLIHWNLPANPVDLEQREGRINRYQNHAIRLNLADLYGNQVPNGPEYWPKLFAFAESERPVGSSDIVPHWHVGVPAQDCAYPIISHVPTHAYSKEARRLLELERTLPLYRLALGQPDQEGLVRMFAGLGKGEELDTLRAAGVISLRPESR